MPAITLVRVAQRLQHPLGSMTLLEVTIKTGRTHQIRVHLASQERPIVGDDKYGNFALNKAVQKTGLPRMFLHAALLRLQHPLTGEMLELRAGLPDELANFVKNVDANQKRDFG